MAYAYTALKAEILSDNIEAGTSIRTQINRAVRQVIADLDIKATKRRTQLSPNLFEGVYDYTCPSDLKGLGIIDIQKQVGRILWDDFTLVPVEEFDRRKSLNENVIAISDFDFIKKLRISADIDSRQVTLHEMDSITSNGTWVASGDASNLTVDYNESINGAASLNFDIGGSTTTSGLLTNSTLTAVDLTLYENQQLFVWVYIPTTTDLTSFKLRWGSSASDYWEATATTNNEGTSFYTGWNLLRFAWPSTDTGTPIITAVDYLRLEIVKGASLPASTDWRVDWIVARSGVIHNVLYYSRYGWRTSAGVYLEDSANDTDTINAETDELELFTFKGKQIVFEEAQLWNDAKYWENQYIAKKAEYRRRYKSEAKQVSSEYYRFN